MEPSKRGKRLLTKPKHRSRRANSTLHSTAASGKGIACPSNSDPGACEVGGTTSTPTVPYPGVSLPLP